jgi:hypothetical protein
MNVRIACTSAVLLACFLFHSSCSKNNAPAGNKAFTAVQNDDNCDLVTPSGNYKLGISLTSSEKVTIQVNADRAGDYEFSTDTLDNFYFSAKGKVETPGVHDITLIASGTPQQEGTYRFGLLGSKLHFSVQITNDEQVPLQAVPVGMSISGTIGDETINMSFPQANGDGGYGFGGEDTAMFMSSVAYGQFPNNPPETGDFWLQKQFIYGFYSTSKEQFKEFFKPKSYPIAFAKCETHRSDGFLVSWTDHAATSWSTKKDYDQSGSYVRILGIEDGYRTDGQYFVKTFAHIKCKMYRYPDDVMRELNADVVSYFVRPGP